MDTEDIPEGMCLAVAMIFNIIGRYNEYDFEDVESFAERLAFEAGNIGKNVAALMMAGNDLWDIDSTDFFSDEYADEYEEYEDDGED